jgi:hypothetical protein
MEDEIHRRHPHSSPAQVAHDTHDTHDTHTPHTRHTTDFALGL